MCHVTSECKERWRGLLELDGSNEAAVRAESQGPLPPKGTGVGGWALGLHGKFCVCGLL